MNRLRTASATEQAVQVDTGTVVLEGNLALPAGTAGVVLFAHGSGSGRHSPRNRFVAERLQAAGVGTLLIDLLTEREEAIDSRTAHLRFDIGLLADRLVALTRLESLSYEAVRLVLKKTISNPGSVRNGVFQLLSVPNLSGGWKMSWICTPNLINQPFP